MKPNDTLIHSGIWAFWIAGLYVGIRYNIISDKGSLVFVLWLMWVIGISFFWLVSLGNLINTLVVKLVKKRDLNSKIRENEDNTDLTHLVKK